MSATTFFAIMLASMIDPLSLIGYLLAGLLVRTYWVAVVVALGWRILLFAALSRAGSAQFLVPALVGGLMVVSATFAIRRTFRVKSRN